MAICVCCSNCGKKFRAASKHGGKQTKCPNCSEPLVIPYSQDDVLFDSGSVDESGSPEEKQQSGQRKKDGDTTNQDGETLRRLFNRRRTPNAPGTEHTPRTPDVTSGSNTLGKALPIEQELEDAPTQRSRGTIEQKQRERAGKRNRKRQQQYDQLMKRKRALDAESPLALRLGRSSHLSPELDFEYQRKLREWKENHDSKVKRWKQDLELWQKGETRLKRSLNSLLVWSVIGSIPFLFGLPLGLHLADAVVPWLTLRDGLLIGVAALFSAVTATLLGWRWLDQGAAVGCLYFPVSAAIIAGVLLASKVHTAKESISWLDRQMSSYTSIPQLKGEEVNGQPKSALINGKVVTIDVDQKRLDRIFYRLPTSMRAGNAKEVQAIVWIEWGASRVGSYPDAAGEGLFVPRGVGAYRTTCRVTVIDYRDPPKVVASDFFKGPSPPSEVSVASNEDVYGPKPIQEVVDFLMSLRSE